MTSDDLARAYPSKVQVRLEVLGILRDRGAHSDVVREAQELVERALEGVPRAVVVGPPKWHDVGRLLVEHARRFPPDVAQHLARAASGSESMSRAARPRGGTR